MYFSLNTTIPLKKLTKDNLDYILSTYNLVGLIAPSPVPGLTVKNIQSRITSSASCSFELTPNICLPNNKLIFSEKYASDNKPYVHVQVIPNSEIDSNVKDILLKFDYLIRKKLYM